jgi:hypothetical protein
MARVTVLSATATTNSGYRVETDAGGHSYLYSFRRVEPDSNELRLVARYQDRDPVEPRVTDAVRDALPDHVDVVEP